MAKSKKTSKKAGSTAAKKTTKKSAAKKTTAKSVAKKAPAKKTDTPAAAKNPAAPDAVSRDCMCKQKKANGNFFYFRLEQGRWVQASGIGFPTKEACEAAFCEE